MNIGAVIVTYHPPAQLADSVPALLEQVDEVVIVDNGSGEADRKMLERLSGKPGVRVVLNADNLGVAAALNAGVQRLMASGCAWVLTLDQDSRVTPGMVRKMLDAYEAFPGRDKVASLAPRYRDVGNGQVTPVRPAPLHDGMPHSTEVLAVMTSGNLVKAQVFESVGYFNEALFIDHVDNEFCLRCARQGYKILEVRDALLDHRTGTPARYRFLGKLRSTSNHSAMRRYYMARNGVYMCRHFLLSYPDWVLRDAYQFIRSVMAMLLFEDGKQAKLAAVLRGVAHGVMGRMGRLDGGKPNTGMKQERQDRE